MTLDDAELLRRYVREGAKDAFGELVQRHLDVVYHAALRQVGGDPHWAEEVAQDVFTLLARKAPSLTEHPMLIGWLFSATRRTAWRLMRTERRRLEREHEAWAMNEGDTASDGESWETLRPVLDESLNQLKPADRDVLLLRYFQERPFAEIGQRFAVSEDAARMRVERALERLRARLVRRGIASTSAALGMLLANNAVAVAPGGLATSVTTVALSQATAAGGGLAAFMAKLFLMTKTQMAVLGGLAFLLSLVWAAELFAARRLGAEIVSLQAQAAVATRIQEQEAQLVVDKAKTSMSDPAQVEIDALRKKVLRANLDGQYAQLFRRLKLQPSELEVLKDLLVDWCAVAQEAARLASAEGVTRLADTKKIQMAATEELGERIHAVLGDARFAYFKFYVETLPARGSQQMLERWLTARGISLSDDQSDALVKLHFSEGYENVMNSMTAEHAESALATLKPEQRKLFAIWNGFLGAWSELSRMNREAAAQGKIKLPSVTVDNNGNTKYSSP